MLRPSTAHLHRRGVDIRAPGYLTREQQMIRVQPATPATDDEPDDLAMRLVEIGLAVLAAIAAGVLALAR
jgi:hypothetical protein